MARRRRSASPVCCPVGDRFGLILPGLSAHERRGDRTRRRPQSLALEQEILGGQVLADTGRGISVDVSLDDRVAIGFKPGHAVGDHVGILTSEVEGLVPRLPAAGSVASPANIRIDRRQVDHIRQVHEVGDGIAGRGRGAAFRYMSSLSDRLSSQQSFSSTAARFPDGRVRDDRILSPEILLRKANESQTRSASRLAMRRGQCRIC